MLLAASPVLAEGPATPERLYSLDVTQQDIRGVLKEFARRTGKPVSLLDMPSQLVTFTFKDLPFEQALAQIVAADALEFRFVNGGYVVGLPVDLRLRFPQDGEKELDATYRCRRVGASSLADSIGRIMPDLKITTGPTFLSPGLDGSSSRSSTGDGIRALAATETALKTHDVVFSGPAASVRRALTLAQKFDRPRKQVRIAIKIVTMETNASQSLGINWMDQIAFNTTEQVPAGQTGNLVNGIRLGKFSHTPLVVNTTLSALEDKGKAKVLSNPTLTLLDGERSFILSGGRYLYPKYTGKDQNGQSIYDVAEAKIGVYLQVGVQIGLDNDMILSLYPQVTSLGSTRQINGAEYPTINTSEEQTTVRALSGEVLVLGGMLQDNVQDNATGLPLLGRLFGNFTKASSKSELMLVLTPELVDEPAPQVKMEMSVSDPAPSPQPLGTPDGGGQPGLLPEHPREVGLGTEPKGF
jgi:hypothetical protein